MRKSWVRWIVGIVAFALPVLMSIIGLRMDRSSLRHDPMYAALIPVVMWSSVALAAVVPASLILTSTLSLCRRIELMAAMWCLLALECGLVLYVGLMESLH